MATSILLKFLTLGWDISRTIGRIDVSGGSFFCIVHALSFELNLFLNWSFPLTQIFLNIIVKTCIMGIFMIFSRSTESDGFIGSQLRKKGSNPQAEVVIE